MYRAFLDGKHLIIGTRGEIIVFERQLEHFYREVKRLRGHVGEINACPFSKDNKYVISGGEDRIVRIWNLETGECIDVWRVHKSSVIGCEFSHDRTHFLSVDNNGTVNNCDLMKMRYRSISFIPSATNCGYIPSSSSAEMFFVGSNKNIVFYDISTDQYLQKSSYHTHHAFHNKSKVISDGKQITIGKENGTFQVLDIIRNHAIKCIKNETNSLSYTTLGTVILSTSDTAIKIQDVANGRFKWGKTCGEFKDWSIDPVADNSICVLTNDNKVIFVDLTRAEDNITSKLIRGINQKGLQLTGANIDESNGFSDENIMLFDQMGDYKGLGKKMIQEFILDNRNPNAEKYTSLDLSNGKLNAQIAKIIRRNWKFIHIQRLDLSLNSSRRVEASAIGNNQTWVNLQGPLHDLPQMNDEAVILIAMNQGWKNLKKLHLCWNNISKSGAQALVQNTWENLEDLNLTQNQLGKEGAVELASNNSWKNLKKLNLSANQILKIGAQWQLPKIPFGHVWSCWIYREALLATEVRLP